MHDWLHVCIVHHMYAWYLRKPEGEVSSLGTEVTGSFEPPCRCWELNPSLLQVLLTPEPSSSPKVSF